MAHPRLVMIGWDAAECSVVEAGLRQGDLPVLAALRRRGLWGRVAGLPGLGDDGCWATFATGVEPGRHGRFHHRQIVPGSYRLDNFFRDRMSGEAFWSQLGRAGRRVAVLDVPKSPLASDLNGIQLADWLSHGEDGGELLSWPPSLAAELPARFHVRPGFSCHSRKVRLEELRELLARTREHLAQRTALALEWLGREPWDLFLAAFAESHCVGHHCWHLHDQAHPQHERDALRVLGDPIRDTHRDLDTALGELLAACGTETTVIVFALIGMGSTWMGSGIFDEVLRRLEQRYEDGASRRSGGFRRLAAATRHWLTRATGGVAATDVAFAGRCAFPVETDAVASAVRINLVGREPHGRVRREMYDDFRTFLESALQALVDPDSGRPLVSEVIRVADRYAGPRSSACADLLVVWDTTAPIHAAASPAIGIVRGAPMSERFGNHLTGGWFVAAGPGIEPGELPAAAAIVDLPATAAAILGVELEGAEGTPIGALRVPDRSRPNQSRGVAAVLHFRE